MRIQVFRKKVSRTELEALAKETFVDMVKGVADLRLKVVAFGGELHADCEDVLLEEGSQQSDLWGFNIYLNKDKENRLEYTSLINIRPRDGNLGRELKIEPLRQKLKQIIDEMVE